jgi:hypothetical protein
MSDHGSIPGRGVEQRYEQADFDRHRRIAESEARHAAYDDPPPSKRWWQFWKRAGQADTTGQR